MKHTPEERKENKAPARHRAICFILEKLGEGLRLSHCLHLAADKNWDGRHCSTLQSAPEQQWF